MMLDMQQASSRKRISGKFRPDWLEELITSYQGRIARQFLLHFNINDFVFNMDSKEQDARGKFQRAGNVVENGDTLLTVREYLHRFLFKELQCCAVYTYSLAGGLIVSDGWQEKQERHDFVELGSMGEHVAGDAQERSGPAWQHIRDALTTLHTSKRRQDGQPMEGNELELPDDLPGNFKLLGHVLRRRYGLSAQAKPGERETPVAVIIDYVEKLIPYNIDEGQGDREQLQALEVIQRWALDPLIRQTNNVIILLTNNIGQIPKSVYGPGSGCPAIRVPLPVEREREAFIRFLMSRARTPLVNLHRGDFGNTAEVQAARLASATQGMRLSDIDNISRQVIIEYRKYHRDDANFKVGSEVMRGEDVQKAKGQVIETQSAGLLEIVPPVRGFSEIGGLEKLKGYLKMRTDLMLDRSHLPLVPSGLLLAGPPGTGKTIIAEALATESHFNLVKMRNIQDKWVGSSERNLELVLNLLEDLHPVVVFIDEIDQAVGRRDTGQNGDSGVSARMFGRILEAMSNAATRGRILWVAATNRADLLDDALIRRFDRVIPLLTPDVDEACRIFATMPRTIARQSGSNAGITYSRGLMQTEVDWRCFRLFAEQVYEAGITGAGIEIIVRRAIELAYEEALQKAGEEATLQLAGIEKRHLEKAIEDYKPNHNRASYDYQSLLAIRASNFHSVIPELPDSGPFSRIKGDDGRVDPMKLANEIKKIQRELPPGAR